MTMELKHKWSTIIVLLILSSLCYANQPPTKNINLIFLEEQKAGTEIYNLKSDLSESENSAVTFRLSRQDLYLDKRIIDSKTQWVSLDRVSGSLTVNTPLDRETDCGVDATNCHINVHIIEIANGPPIQFIVLHLDITDFNDHEPQFPVNVIDVNVSENADVGSYPVNLDRYLATDQDIGVNARIHYSISRNNFFGLRESKDQTGAPHLELVVASALDQETTPIFHLQLTATDRGQPTRSSEIMINIHIIDENDNSPTFDKPLYVITLPENINVGAEIITLVAHDADTGVFSKIKYFIPSIGNTASAQNLVQINPNSGVVTLNERLDFDKHNNFRVVIGAKDGTENDFKIGKTTLEFRVNDINDNAPKINIVIISDALGDAACVSENAVVDTYVAQVITRDADQGKNSQVLVSITSQSIVPTTQQINQEFDKAFTITEGGFIKTGILMDREQISSYLINIVACDQGVPVLCSEKNLTVEILDENDHSPIFQHVDTNIVLPEDAKLGTLVSTVMATDQDSIYIPAYSVGKNGIVGPSRNGKITYTLEGGDGTFIINEKSGKITLVISLDYEEIKQWKLVAIATDGGTPSKSSNTTIVVDIININDHAPRIIKPAANATIYTTILRKDPVVIIKAEDYDAGSENKVKFSIVREDGRKRARLFVIDQNSGALKLNFSIPDMRTVLGEHKLIIQVEDTGKPPKKTNTSFTIKVTELEPSVIDAHFNSEPIGQKSKANLTIVFVASLSTVTVLLMLVLAGVVIKCRRENKEIRTYNCRNAETKQGWQLASSQGSLQDDIIVTSSNHLMASRDSVMTWNQNADTRISYEARRFQKNKQTYSVPNLTNSSAMLERKFSSFSKIPRPDAVNQQPQTQQVDGDSGRGDSDHDTQSNEERESFQANNNNVSEHLIEQNATMIGNLPESDTMGPLCTHLCRQYGHSDACWMHVLENDQVQETIYPTNHVYDSQHRPTTPSYRYYNSNSISSRSGLETICETQPLHSVLGNSPHQYIEADDQYQEDDYIDNNGYNHFAPNEENYSVDGYTTSYPSLTSFNQTMPSYSSPRHQKQHELSGARHSASDLFHDGQNPHQPYLPSLDPNASLHYQHSEHNSRSSSPMSQNCHTNKGSIYSDLLNKRYLAARQCDLNSRNAEGGVTTPQHFGHVSMQETQQIIDDIDQLIDH